MDTDKFATMRNLIVAFSLGTSLALSLLNGEEALRNGEQWWPLWLIVFPLVSLGGLAATLYDHWKRFHSRRGDIGESPHPPNR
ncbi:hypothetical protein M3G43_08410 [Brevibacterium casei]|uniref:hypothetical protein n=2 Tax=Brevibacterium casei TaxID=33889 RepID=UPI00223B0F88|nr:hypothetical protein [Brevibacterium casei]MCT1447277.1 hypothetical protein [Brevibacterium casei]